MDILLTPYNAQRTTEQYYDFSKDDIEAPKYVVFLSFLMHSHLQIPF